jgi:hypothetical protein
MVGYIDKSNFFSADKNMSEHFSVIRVTRPSCVFYQQHNDPKFSAGMALESSFS